MTLSARYILRKKSILVDQLSRSEQVLPTKWSLLPRVFDAICEVYSHSLSVYIPWPFPPVWEVADNTKETTKTMGISLRSSSNDKGPSRVWMALLEQHNPSSPIFSHGLIYNKSNYEASIIYFSSSGSNGMEARFISTSLERSQCFCIPPFCPSKTSLVRSDAFDKSPLSPGSSSLAPGVVHRSSAPSGGRTS